jgi:hypothetical protein
MKYIFGKRLAPTAVAICMGLTSAAARADNLMCIRRLDWNGPQVSRLRQAIQILRERITHDHSGCEPRFASPDEVKDW